MRKHTVPLLLAALTTTLPSLASAQVFRWDNGQLCPGTENIPPAPDADFTGFNTPAKTLAFASLSGISLNSVVFNSSILTSARFNGSTITRARFNATTPLGFTAAQLYSTASYQNRNLTGIQLSSNNLTAWNFASQNLTGASLLTATLTSANFTGANLSTTMFDSSNLQSADFTAANITRTRFNATTLLGFTAAQLYSTANYQNRNLTGIQLERNNLTGWNFASQNLNAAFLGTSTLTSANFTSANLANAALDSSTLTSANFTGATVTDTDFRATTALGFTAAQLYSTASYQNRNLSDINLSANNLTGWNFASQNLTSTLLATANFTSANFTSANLTNATLFSSTLTSANFTGATVTLANFSSTTPLGFTAAQLYTTASYQIRNLTDFDLENNNLSTWNFNSQDLTSADFDSSNLTNATFNAATVTAADFTNTTATGFTAAQLSSTASYLVRNLTRIRLSENNLTGWNFNSQNLTTAQLLTSNLTSARFISANLTDANLTSANLTSTIFTGATVTGANFRGTTSLGFTAAQLSSTASYQNRDLTEIDLSNNQLIGWTFTSQNLTSARFDTTSLTLARFDAANVTATNFRNTTAFGFIPEQLYSTASYINRDLTDIRLGSNNLTQWNFASQNLTQADLATATLTSANFTLANLTFASLSTSTLTSARFTRAIITGASFRATTALGFTAAQLSSTASYVNRDLTGIDLAENDLTGWNFTSQRLTEAFFFSSNLTSTNFTFADLRDAFNFLPVATTITRGAILPNASVSPFTFLSGETLRIRQYPFFPTTITSTGTISAPLSGTATITLDPGITLLLAPPALPSSSPRTLDNVALVINATPELPSIVRASTMTSGPSGRTFAPTTTVLTTLSIASDAAPLSSRIYYGFLDLGTNDAILRNTPLAEVRSMVRHWLTANAGLPGSTGLGTSAAFYTPEGAFTTLAVYDNSIPGDTRATFNGQLVSPTDLLIKYTYLGDTNIDGVVNAADLSRLLQGLNGQGSGWNFGDVNYDGLVNFTDLGRLQAALRGQGSPLTDIGSVTPGGVIPEPSSLALLSLPALTLLRLPQATSRGRRR